MPVAHAKKMNAKRLAEIAKRIKGWADIGKIESACDRADFWDEEFLEGATRNAKRSLIRRLIRHAKDETGWPEFASIEAKNEEGKIVQVYKQELLFDIGDYQQCVNYWHGRARYATKMRDGYRRRCIEKFDKQLSLPYGD